MTKHTKNLRTHFLLTFCLILHVLPLPVQAQGQPIVFSFGRPSIWSLEQAHYLLARMHAENLGLVSKWPDDDVLDPNATNASRINLLKSMLELGVTYDQTAGLQNQATQRNFNRLQVLDGRLDARREELKTIEKELAALKVEEAEAKKNNPNDLNLPLKRVAVENKDAEKNRVNAEITSLEAERKELPKSSATPTKAEAGAADPTQLPDTLYETMLKNNNLNEKLKPDAKLAATTALDNHIQLQYEIIAKQLTLLRDEVGPNERLVFLEMPQSLYTTPGIADEMVAQVWWKITEASKKAEEQASLKQARRQLLQAQGINLSAATAPKDLVNFARVVDIIPRQSSLNVNDIQDTVNRKSFVGVLNLLMGFGAKVSYQRQKELYEQYIHQEQFASGFGKGAQEFGWTFGPVPGSSRVAPGVRTTYAVMVVHKDTKELTLSATGCYFRRKMNAPINFAATADAAWTTPRDSHKCKCIPASQTFKIPIPGANEDRFYVTDVNYRTVRPGERIVVHLLGDNFSTQTSVLINGTPLKNANGLGQPLLAPRKPKLPEGDKGMVVTPSENGQTGISGEFERINERQIVMSFKMGANEGGTPTMTLIAPGRASDINHFPLIINGRPRKHLSDKDIAPMFASPSALALDELEILGLVPAPGTTKKLLDARLTGRGFYTGLDEIFINNVKVDPTERSAQKYRVIFPAPITNSISIRLLQGDSEVLRSFPNPLFLDINDVQKTYYDSGTKILTLKITGNNLNTQTQYDVKGATKKNFRILSDGVAELEVSDPKEKLIITLTNPDTGQSDQYEYEFKP